ncbi:hypothetical protein F2Q69_00046129 [Brassica cretica]|uniref:Uncharacterized protein n=1 Tax=Brassica cretica TaxID=69181 RepID=A0A8S9PW98_BRACR|nr:hypothetical protein F2Q69_00046129 [Brassica cretica]
MKRLHQKNPTPAMASSSFFLLHDRQSEKRHLFFCLIKRHSFRQKLRDMLARDKLRDMLARDKNLKFILTGDEEFGEYMKEVMKKHGIEYERFVYNNDMVTRVPFDDKILFGYKHYGSCNYFNSLYKGKVN